AKARGLIEVRGRSRPWSSVRSLLVRKHEASLKHPQAAAQIAGGEALLVRKHEASLKRVALAFFTLRFEHSPRAKARGLIEAGWRAHPSSGPRVSPRAKARGLIEAQWPP